MKYLPKWVWVQLMEQKVHMQIRNVETEMMNGICLLEAIDQKDRECSVWIQQPLLTQFFLSS
jgi:hypothetical protein